MQACVAGQVKAGELIGSHIQFLQLRVMAQVELRQVVANQFGHRQLGIVCQVQCGKSIASGLENPKLWASLNIQFAQLTITYVQFDEVGFVREVKVVQLVSEQVEILQMSVSAQVYARNLIVVCYRRIAGEVGIGNRSGNGYRRAVGVVYRHSSCLCRAESVSNGRAVAPVHLYFAAVSGRSQHVQLWSGRRDR